MFTRLVGLLFKMYSRRALLVRGITLTGSERYIAEFKNALAGKSRFMVAFRHPGDADPHVVFGVLTALMKGPLKKAGIQTPSLPRFLSGAEIPLWGGPVVRLALGLSGAIPVRHSEGDRKTMDEIISHMVTSPQPIVLAPEGQITYHCERIGVLDAGCMNLAWLASRQMDGKLPVHIIPLGIRYDYGTGSDSDWKGLIRELERLEIETGKPPSPDDITPRERLLALWEHLVAISESWYTGTYHVEFPPESSLSARHFRLVEMALSRVESFYGLKTEGSPEHRILSVRAYQLRLASVPKGISGLHRDLAERRVGECFYISRHQELADLCVHMHPEYLPPGASFSRHAEVLQNLSDFANRLRGGTIGTRKRLFSKTVDITFGEPVFPGTGNRKSAVAAGNEELRRAFQILLT